MQLLQKNPAKAVIIEQAVEVGAPDTAIRCDPAIGHFEGPAVAADNLEGRLPLPLGCRNPHVNLVGRQHPAIPRVRHPGLHLGGGLGPGHGGHYGQEIEPGFGPGVAFHPQGVPDFPAQDLIAAADAHQAAAGPAVGLNPPKQAASLEIKQVADGVLGPGQDQKVQAGELIPLVQVTEIHPGLLLQGVKVGVVGDVGQPHHADPEAARRFPGSRHALPV